MGKMTLCFAIIAVVMTACFSDPKVVNDQARPPILPVEPYGNPDAIHGRVAQPPMVAVSGSVVVGGQLPIPASGASVSLHWVQSDGSTKKVSEMTTGPDGRFEFSQRLQKGNYLIKVNDRRYQGEKSLHNLSNPALDVIVEVEETKRQSQ